MGTGRAFQKAGRAMEKALDSVLGFIRGMENLIKFVKCRYFEYFGRKVNQPDMQVVCLLGFWKLYHGAYFKMNAEIDRKPLQLF